MDRDRLYLHDADPAELRGRRVQLTEQLGEAGLADAWEVMATPSRNSLLTSIAADASEGRRSVSLIDLRAETGDLDQLGFRICEAIVRHRALNGSTIPIVWAETHTAANLGLARTVGAVAIVDDAWVDTGGGSPLGEVLAWAAAQPSSPAEAVGADTRVFAAGTSTVTDEHARRDRLFERWFGFAPRQLHYSILWGMADAVELSFLDRYMAAAGLAGSERVARRERERLQAAMGPQVEALEGPNPARAEIARRFLAEAAPAEPPRLPELSWPMMDHVRDLVASDADAVRWSFASTAAMAGLRAFLHRLEPRRLGRRQGASEAHAEIEEALGEMRAPAGTRELVRSAAHAIDDAYRDWRDHGPPVPMRG